MKKILTSSIMSMMVAVSLTCALKAADAGGGKKPAPAHPLTIATCEQFRDALVVCHRVGKIPAPINSPAIAGLGCQAAYMKCVQMGANMNPKPPAHHKPGSGGPQGSGIPPK